MLLVVSPNLAVDRIVQVPCFALAKVQRSRSVLVQPGGKGSNVARVFRQLGGDVVLLGFVGKQNGGWIVKMLRQSGIVVDTVTAYSGETRTCTIVCDSKSQTHPTVINEESPEIEPGSAAKLLAKVERWIPRVDAVLTTGSLSSGLPSDFYAQILDRGRQCGKLTALDAAGEALRQGVLSNPFFMKPNAEEFRQFVDGQSLSMLSPHTAVTFGDAGAVLIQNGTCIYASPRRIETTNPIGAGDAFAAGYLKSLLNSGSPEDSLKCGMAAGACDAATLRPGFVDYTAFLSLISKPFPIFQSSTPGGIT